MSTATPAPSPANPLAIAAPLLRLAWPIVLARATQAVIGFCDALFVAPLGEAPLAATTTGALNAFSVILFPMGTVFILQSFVAQLRGRGASAGLARYAYYGLSLALGAGLLAAAVIPFLPRLLGLFRYEPAVHRLMSTYLGIRLLSVAPAVGMEALGNWYGGLGNTRPSMVAGVVAMVANVAGCYVFIEPRFGLPGFGVAGAAWASVGASWLGFTVIFALFLAETRREGPVLRRLRAREFLRVLRFGGPNGVNWLLEFAAFALFINAVVGHLGTTVLAALNVVMQINSVSFMPAFGLASGGAILVGEAIGRKAHDEVWPILRVTAAMACAWMVGVGLLYASVPERLMALFQPEGAPVGALMKTGALMLVFSAVWQLFDALSLTFGEALRAAGDTAWCMAARIGLAWLVFTPLAWASVLVFGGGVQTVMVSLVSYLFAVATALVLRFRLGPWRRIDLVGTADEAELADEA